MWFKNLQIYRVENIPALEKAEAVLALHALQPCGANDYYCLGWIPPREGGAYIKAVGRQWLIALGLEKKILPTAIVKRRAQERARQIEADEGRRVGRREFRELVEAAIPELLPRAFTKESVTHAWIDLDNGMLGVDSASPDAADLLRNLLCSQMKLQIAPVRTHLPPAAAMTQWIADGHAPDGFTLDRDAELVSVEDASVRYAKHPLDGAELPRHVADGKSVVRLGMTWEDSLSFVLDKGRRIRRLACTDKLKEPDDYAGNMDKDVLFDTEFALMTGTYSAMLPDLLIALGGEVFYDRDAIFTKK
jgi:recombination associated protein RdgC